MERYPFLKHPVFLAFTSFVLLFTLFKFGPKIPLSIISQQKGESFMVEGTGRVSVTPDIARVNIGVEESGASLKQVQDSVNKKSQNIVSELKKLGIAEKDIKTTSYNVYPDYNYRSDPATITGYRVATRYQVTIRDFESVNDVLVLTAGTGANVAGNISFDISDEIKNEKLQEAREEAVNEAKDKAQGLAKAAGISLGKIINVSESQNGIPYRDYLSPVGGGGLAEEQITQPDIQPGETELLLTVTLSYEIR